MIRGIPDVVCKTYKVRKYDIYFMFLTQMNFSKRFTIFTQNIYIYVFFSDEIELYSYIYIYLIKYMLVISSVLGVLGYTIIHTLVLYPDDHFVI